MNRGHILQSSPVQQMMTAGSAPNWWRNLRPPSSHQQVVSSASFLGSAAAGPNFLIPNSQYMHTSSSSWGDEDDHHNQELPESLSQLLLGGFVSEEEKNSGVQMQTNKKLEMNWEGQLLLQQHTPNGSVVDHFKNDENSSATPYSLYSNSSSHENAEFQAAAGAVRPNGNWSTQVIPVSSPTSCVTTLSSTNNMLDFSSSANHSKSDGRHPHQDRSSECNSTVSLGGGVAKKARVQTSSTQSTFKVRKEKLGDRITALHQIVSPFGKTDTASVLLEAIGYIRFLQSQIEALSLPYLGNSKSGNMRQQQQQHLVQGGERNCLFPEDPGQLLNENAKKRKAMSDQECEEEPKKDLRSRGLCLVPISCTLQVGSDNGADYWAPALGGGFR